MFVDGQTQIVPRVLLDKKLGKTLALNEIFTTKRGTWKVICLNVEPETYTVEMISDVTTDST